MGAANTIGRTTTSFASVGDDPRPRSGIGRPSSRPGWLPDWSRFRRTKAIKPHARPSLAGLLRLTGFGTAASVSVVQVPAVVCRTSDEDIYRLLGVDTVPDAGSARASRVTDTRIDAGVEEVDDQVGDADGGRHDEGHVHQRVQVAVSD
jgi:hypothetical protein